MWVSSQPGYPIRYVRIFIAVVLWNQLAVMVPIVLVHWTKSLHALPTVRALSISF